MFRNRLGLGKFVPAIFQCTNDNIGTYSETCIKQTPTGPLQVSV